MPSGVRCPVLWILPNFAFYSLESGLPHVETVATSNQRGSWASSPPFSTGGGAYHPRVLPTVHWLSTFPLPTRSAPLVDQLAPLGIRPGGAAADSRGGGAEGTMRERSCGFALIPESFGKFGEIGIKIRGDKLFATFKTAWEPLGGNSDFQLFRACQLDP